MKNAIYCMKSQLSKSRSRVTNSEHLTSKTLGLLKKTKAVMKGHKVWTEECIVNVPLGNGKRSVKNAKDLEKLVALSSSSHGKRVETPPFDKSNREPSQERQSPASQHVR